MNTVSFNNLMAKVDDLTDAQTFKLMLELRTLGVGDVDQLKECIASYNSLSEEDIIKMLRHCKSQFNNSEDWDNLVEIL